MVDENTTQDDGFAPFTFHRRQPSDQQPPADEQPSQNTTGSTGSTTQPPAGNPFTFHRRPAHAAPEPQQPEQNTPTAPADYTANNAPTVATANNANNVHSDNSVHTVPTVNTGSNVNTGSTARNARTANNAGTVNNGGNGRTGNNVNSARTVNNAGSERTVNNGNNANNVRNANSGHSVNGARGTRIPGERGRSQYSGSRAYDDAMLDDDVVDNSNNYSSFLDMGDEDEDSFDQSITDTDYNALLQISEDITGDAVTNDSDENDDDADAWMPNTSIDGEQTPEQREALRDTLAGMTAPNGRPVNADDYTVNNGNTGSSGNTHTGGSRVDYPDTPGTASTLSKQARADAVRQGVKEAQRGDFVLTSITKPLSNAGTTHEQDLFLIRRQVTKRKRIPWSKHDMDVMDYLTRWQFGTTSMLAQAGGFHDSNLGRLHKRFKNYEDLGLVLSNNVFAGPVLWLIRNAGSNLSTRPWLKGINLTKINPSTMSHYLGLSSIASQLYALSPQNMTADILHLDDFDGDGAWYELAEEFESGESWLISEKEYRSAWSSLRVKQRGLISEEYRLAFQNELYDWYGDNGDNLEAELAAGHDDYLLESPELAACYPDDEGEHMYKWVVWGNSIWNTNLNDGRGGLIPIQSRMIDANTLRPILDFDGGDRFATEDHCPDIVIARKRARNGGARSIAIELELHPKPVEHYMKILAGYLSEDGQNLYRNVIWLVARKSTRNSLLRAMRNLGDPELESIVRIIPFWTEERRNSFWSGADIVRGRWLDEERSNKIVRDDGNEKLEDIIDLRGRGRTDIRKARQYLNSHRRGI